MQIKTIMAIPEFDNNSTQPEPESVSMDSSTQQALLRQQVTLLTADIEQLRTLYQLYKKSPTGAQFTLLSSRVNRSLKRAEELIAKVVLEPEQLKQMQEDKQFLGMMAFEMAGGFKKKPGQEGVALIEGPRRRSFGQIGDGGLRCNRGVGREGRRLEQRSRDKLDKLEKECLELQRLCLETSLKPGEGSNAYGCLLNPFPDYDYFKFY